MENFDENNYNRNDAYDRISDVCVRHPDDNIDMVFAGNDDLLATAQGSKNSRQFKMRKNF